MKRHSFASKGTDDVARDLSDAALCAAFPRNFASMYAFVAEHSDLVHSRENAAGWRWCVSDQVWTFYNTVLNLQGDLFSRDVDALDEVLDDFRKHGVPCRISLPCKTTSVPHPDVHTRRFEKHLESRGFVMMDTGEPNMYAFDLDELPKRRERMERALNAEKLTSFVELVELDMSSGSERGGEGFSRVYAAANSMPNQAQWFVDSFEHMVFGKKSSNDDGFHPLRIFGAIEKATEKLLSAVLLYGDGDTVGIYSLSTVKEGRGRGIGTALMYRCMLASVEAGYRHMLLASTPKARPLYERMGFRPIGRSREMICFKHCGVLASLLSAYLGTFGPKVWPLVAAAGGAVVGVSVPALWTMSSYLWV